jgi:hypothetical protein
MGTVPYFLWSDDDQVSEEELRRLLSSDDPAERSLWRFLLLRRGKHRPVLAPALSQPELS